MALNVWDSGYAGLDTPSSTWFTTMNPRTGPLSLVEINPIFAASKCSMNNFYGFAIEDS